MFYHLLSGLWVVILSRVYLYSIPLAILSSTIVLAIVLNIILMIIPLLEYLSVLDISIVSKDW